jgi:hypothetical protein
MVPALLRRCRAAAGEADRDDGYSGEDASARFRTVTEDLLPSGSRERRRRSDAGMTFV